MIPTPHTHSHTFIHAAYRERVEKDSQEEQDEEENDESQNEPFKLPPHYEPQSLIRRREPQEGGFRTPAQR